MSGLKTFVHLLCFWIVIYEIYDLSEQVSRYLKKIEKDEAYLGSLSGLGPIIKTLRFSDCHL